MKEQKVNHQNTLINIKEILVKNIIITDPLKSLETNNDIKD